jgi:hypothetical protein
MNFIQRIRAMPLNRHGFIDALVGVVLFQIFYISLVLSLDRTEIDTQGLETVSTSMLFFTALLLAPISENLLLVGLAALHEKIFNRTALFIVAPLLLTSLHFIHSKPLSYPIYLRVASLFFFFYVYLKQYDAHQAELGKLKAFLLSCLVHFAVNASGILIVCLLDPDIDAETIFSAQPGE